MTALRLVLILAQSEPMQQKSSYHLMFLQRLPVRHTDTCKEALGVIAASHCDA